MSEISQATVSPLQVKAAKLAVKIANQRGDRLAPLIYRIADALPAKPSSASGQQAS